MPQPSFDPRAHTTHAPRAFAEFKLGETFRAPSRTMTDAYFQVFQNLTMPHAVIS